VPVAPVHETDRVLLPKGLNALKQVATQLGVDRRGASLNRDGGCDSAYHRQCIFTAGLIPNIPEHPRNRKPTRRGGKRFFNAAIHALRAHVEQTFAWEEKCKRRRLRCQRIQQRHSGMPVLAYTLMNLRAFCGPSNLQPVRGYMMRSRKTSHKIIATRSIG
jgi:transposase